MISFLQDPQVFQLFGILGTAFALVGALIAGLFYVGKQNERFSPLNHFISELGEVGVSPLAWVFNLGLILAGLCLIPACISLGLIIPGVLAKIAMVAGIVCALSLSLVGVFPMNKLKPHGFAAMTFFRGGLLMLILFSLTLGLQSGPDPVISRWYALAGLPPMIAFSTFLVLVAKAYKQTEDALSPGDIERPRVWGLVIAEWAILVTVVLWFVLIAIGL
ncbi:MAG: DUF998 domain-containing protein [Anaerolineales bacterium]